MKRTVSLRFFCYTDAMKDQRYIRILKIFIATLLALYFGGIAFPWAQIAFGYKPIPAVNDTVQLSPTEYASTTAITIAVYGAIFVVPLLIASVHTLRSLRTKHSQKSTAEPSES